MYENEFISILDNQEKNIGDIYNGTPLESLDGLSPNEMSRLLYKPIDESNSICSLSTNISNELVQDARFVNDMRTFLTLLHEQASIKLTQSGYLPPALCRTLAELGALDYENWWYEHKKRKVVRETDFHHIHLLHVAAILFGLVKKRRNTLTLTKKGNTLLINNRHIHFYNHILKQYIHTLNWGYPDGYPSASIVQQSVLFSVHLVQKYGEKPHDKAFYATKFVQAFPASIREFPTTSYSTPEEQLMTCYSLRVFERFLNRFGLIRTPKSKIKSIEPDLRFLRKTPLIDALFIWKDIHWL